MSGMSTSIIVRYFYNPVCPETFATLDRLRNVFTDNENVLFETFNMVQDEIQSEYPWFANEEELLETRQGRGEKPLLFGSLFIMGEEIPGFPPSPKHLQQSFEKYGFTWEQEKYPFDYSGKVERHRWKCVDEQFTLENYMACNLKDVSQVCTKHHPYLEPDSFDQEYWKPYEDSKSSFMKLSLEKRDLLGVVAYYNEEPAGFVEAFSLPMAAQLGFSISEITSKGLMVTCLSIRTESMGQGLARQLLQSLEEKAVKSGYDSIEALCFPDEHNWQPVSLYKKLGYQEVRKVQEFKILKKWIRV